MVDAGPVIRQQTRLQNSVINSNNANNNLISRIAVLISIVLRVLLWPFLRLSLLLFPAKEYDGITHTADQAARDFANNFQTRFLPSNNNNTNQNHHNDDDDLLFSNVGYAKSLVAAHRRNRIALVYVHSPLRYSDTFCRDVLARNVDFLQNSFLCWGGTIHTADGQHVAQKLQITSYPYVALMATNATNNQRVDVLWKMTDSGMTADHFLATVQVVQRGYANVMAEIETRRLRREEEIHLRQEQDREFQETLLADQTREAERLAVALAEREAREAEERLALEATRQKDNLLNEARSLLSGGEPTTGATARIRITLPSGVKIDRRFQCNDQIKHVRAFITLWLNDHKNDVPIENFELSSNYPKKTFTNYELTLEEGGLCPMAVLMLQDLDA